MKHTELKSKSKARDDCSIAELPDRTADWAHTRPNDSAYNLQSVLFYLIDITNDDSFNLSAPFLSRLLRLSFFCMLL